MGLEVQVDRVDPAVLRAVKAAAGRLELQAMGKDGPQADPEVAPEAREPACLAAAQEAVVAI